MGLIKNIMKRFFVSPKRKKELVDFVALLNDIKKASSVNDVQEAFTKVMLFRADLREDDEFLKNLISDMVSYLIDTKHHAEKGYHKPQHNGWKTVRSYPDINDYVRVGVKIKTF